MISRGTASRGRLLWAPPCTDIQLNPMSQVCLLQESWKIEKNKHSYLKFHIHEYMFPTSFKWAEDKVLLWTLNIMILLLTYHPAFVIINALLKCEWLLSRIFTPQMPLFHQEILDISACTFDTRMLYIWYLTEPVLSYICILFLCLNFYFVN